MRTIVRQWYEGPALAETCDHSRDDIDLDRVVANGSQRFGSSDTKWIGRGGLGSYLCMGVREEEGVTEEREAQMKALVEVVIEKALAEKKSITQTCGTLIATAFYDPAADSIVSIDVDLYKPQ